MEKLRFWFVVIPGIPACNLKAQKGADKHAVNNDLLPVLPWF